MTAKTTALIAFVLVSSLLVAACVPGQDTGVSNTSDSTTQMSTTPSASPESIETAALENESQATADGETVTTQTTYMSPGGEEAVRFTLVVDEDGVIEEATTDVLAKSPTSILRQTSFAEAFPTVLVGKKLSELTNVDRIGGSSLTTAAFNKSLADLQAQI